MPQTGDYFITTLRRPHLEWGSYRHTNSRQLRYGEGYLQIPRFEAKRIGIYNSNNSNAINTFNCSSTDEYLQNVSLKATGCCSSGDIYAKQFQGNGNLRLLGNWFSHINAHEGDQVQISWISPTHILLDFIRIIPAED